jgi:hypothetical protein
MRRSLPALLLSLAAFGQPQDAPAPTESDLPALIERLSAEDTRRLADYLRLDLSSSDLFQQQLIRHALGMLGKDPGFLEDALPLAWFDPQEHAPGQPIPRRLLAADSPAAERLATALSQRNAPRLWQAGYRYDWGRSQVVRLPGWDDARRELRNAAAGFAPDLDLCEAIACQSLDDGSQAKVLEAFDHAYTDRDGNVYPGVTLFVAWGSGLEIEMPDVDTLGLLHTLFESYPKAWKAPVPASAHKAFYARLEGVYLPAKRHRALREALARCYVEAAPQLWFGFTPAHHIPLQLFWEQRQSSLIEVAATLPGPERWEAFLSDLTRKPNKDEAAHQLAKNRSVGLAAGQARVRQRLLALALDMRLFERYPLDAASTPPTPVH